VIRRVVLVHPENPANVGAVARVIANTGLDGLDLVAPCDGWQAGEARRLAWRAQHVLDGARLFPTLHEAVARSTYVAAWTGRAGMRIDPVTPARCAAEVAALAADAEVALVFGPESRGLREADLLSCGRRVRIPSHPGQPSLNLAQAVMVAGYELLLAERGGRQVGGAAARRRAAGGASSANDRAEAAEIESAYAQLIEAMLAIGFLPPENPEARFVEWRDLFGRAGLTVREVKLLRSLARRMRGAGRLARADGAGEGDGGA